MATVWEGVGRAAGAAAAVIAGAFSFRKVITETIQAEQEQAQLAAALRSTGEAAGWSAEQLNKMADQLASRSTFSAGDITQAQTRLLSYTNIVGNQFPRATQAVIDMCARMGMSVTQSAETIGRALDIRARASPRCSARATTRTTWRSEATGCTATASTATARANRAPTTWP